MAESKFNVLPVVSRSDVRDLKGVVTLNGILQAYGIGSEPHGARELVEPGPPRRLLPAVIAAALILLLLIGYLNYYYRSARGIRAEGYFKTATELAQQNRDAEAVEQFRNALSVSPGNPRYRLALGLELVKMGRLDEGAVYLRELLKSDPGNGPANLGLARISAGRVRTSDAVTYYHRAIDASWPAGQEKTRSEARFEFVDYLAKRGRATQATAELLAILEQTRDDTTKEHVAQLLLQYGSPRQAADLFRQVTASNGKDVAAWAGLGSAELAQDQYADAAGAFRQALDLSPSDGASRRQLSLIENVLALDPNARGIRASERYRRSKALLHGALQILEQCGNAQANQDLKASAHKALDVVPKPGSLGDATEEDLSIAIQLWEARHQQCPANTPTDQAMERVLARLPQLRTESLHGAK